MKKLKYLSIFIFIVLFCGVCAADVDLTSYLENPSFETPILFPLEAVCDAEGWNNFYGYNGVYCPTVVYPVGTTSDPCLPFYASEGNNCLQQIGTTISQVPAVLKIQSNTVYTMQADILVTSAEANSQDAWALLELKAAESDETLGSWGGLYPSLISDFISGFTRDTWYTVTCSFDSASYPSYVGETLAVSAQGDRYYVDNFTLSATGTSVDLTVNATSGAENAVLVPGTGTYSMGDGWTVPLEAMRNYVSCPDLYSFTSWTGANGTTPVTDVTISGNTAVTANYSLTSPGCSDVWSGDYVSIYNADFEDQTASGYNVPYWSKSAAPTSSWVQTPPDGSTGEYLDFTSSGSKMLFVGSGSQLHQVPGDIIESDTVYTVEIDMASRSDVDPDLAWANIRLYARPNTTQVIDNDSTLLIEQKFGAAAVPPELLNPNPDEFYTKSFTWDSTSSPNVGEYLQVYLNGDRVTMDNIRIRKSTQGVAANLTVDSDPCNFSTSGGRPAIYPAAGNYQIAIGAELDLNYAGFRTCPDTFVTGSILTDYGTFAGSEGTILIDGDGSVLFDYATNNVCGDVCHPYPKGDFDENCIVDLDDFADFAAQWLTDNRP